MACASLRQVAARLLFLGIATGCRGEMTTPGTPAAAGPLAATTGTVASVTVIPDSQIVFVGDRFTLIAEPRSSAGDLLDTKVKWTIVKTSLVKAVDTSGQTATFKGIKTGTTNIKATAGGKSRSAKVVVRGTAGARVIVTPADTAIPPGGTVQFEAVGITKDGETAGVNVTWMATGGSVTTDGLLAGGDTPGSYLVIATAQFGAADTANVTIGDAAPQVTQVVLVPEQASITVGDTVRFDAYGLSGAGDSVEVSVTYSASGGSITGSGIYTSGTAGSFQVTAKTAAGVSDDSRVDVTSAPIDRVTIAPDVAASRPGAVTRFSATVWNTLGDTVPEPRVWEASCGTITGTGVYTAPSGQTGSCLVTATAAAKTATTEVVLLSPTLEQGTPFGLYDLWSTPTTLRTAGTAAYTGSHEYFLAADMDDHIRAGQAKGVRLVLAMTGGSHDLYKTDGVFDMAKWKAAMDTYDTQGMRDAVAAAVADGTLIGNSVMDEPQQSGTTTKDWGPKGTMTKARVDSMCSYVKAIFPTLPVGVGHDFRVFQPDSSYRVCEFIMTQYEMRKGDVYIYRDGALAMGNRDRIAILFSINLLNGGPQDNSGAWDCPNSGGLGTREPNCRMTADQVLTFGTVLGRAGCAMLSWRYDTDFMSRPENQAAFSAIALSLADLPRTSCTRW